MVAYYKRRYNRRPKHKHYVNGYIRVSQVRLIDDEGENYGVLSTQEALKKAQEKELDLVLISEKANPPVAKILDYSKFLYDERKKQSSSKSKSSKSDTKEFVFGPNIGESDLQMRIDRTREFLAEGHRVKMTVRLRGRQRAHPEIGLEKIKTVMKALADVAKTEKKPETKGYLISVIFEKK